MSTNILLAQIINPALNPSIQNETGQTFFNSFLPALVEVGFVVGAVFFIFTFIIGAVQWIGSGGNKSSIEEARNKIVNSVVGLVILFSTFVILNLISCFFNINFVQIGVSQLNVTFLGTPVCHNSGGVLPTPPVGTPTPGGTATNTPTLTPTPPGSPIVLNNSASGLTCSQVCSAQGRTCTSIGTDSGGTNTSVWSWIAGNTCAPLSGANCGQPMSASSGVVCSGHTAMWTNCHCQ